MPIISTPFDELLKKACDQRGQKISKEALQLVYKLSQLPKEAFQKLLAQFQQKRETLFQQIETEYQKIITLCNQVIKGSHIKIEVESKEINRVKNSGRPSLISGKVLFTPPGAFKPLEVDCYLSCGHWTKLEELKEGKINILDHLEKLLPKYQGTSSKGPIGLVTFQNGIMNTLDKDFKRMSQLIIDQFPEGPLCIGLYNATTNNLLRDMNRFQSEPTQNVNSVYSLCQMMKTFAELLPKINPNMVWTHFAHSEGGLISHAVLTVCNNYAWLNDVQTYLKGNLIVATYGAVRPVPLEPTLDAVNTYSKKDIALFYGSYYLDKPLDKITEDSYTSTKRYRGYTYKITLIDSRLPIDPLIKLKFEMPEILTLEQRINMTLIERLARLQDYEDSSIGNVVNQKLVNTINDKAHQIKDHGFSEVSYQEVLKNNIMQFRDKYKVYDAKRSF